jgi:3-methyladenine DNA glycosylase AlkD
MSLHTSKKFFIQKTIGWALREYSKTDAEAVKNFVENNELANLSKREAYKWLKNQGKI